MTSEFVIILLKQFLCESFNDMRNEKFMHVRIVVKKDYGVKLDCGSCGGALRHSIMAIQI